MFIAHIPAGYLASNLLSQKSQNRRKLVATGVVCSFLPDLDLLWFYLIDNRQTPHHEYIFHWPLFWIACGSIAAVIAWALGRASLWPYIVTALACLLLHLLLDSFAAEIFWLRPFSDWHLNVVKVPARFDWWIWNFVLHWTFLAEIVICSAAGALFWRRRRARSDH